MIHKLSRNYQQNSHFLSSSELLDERQKSTSKKVWDNKKNEESLSFDKQVSKRILPLRLKNNETTTTKTIVTRPVIRVHVKFDYNIVIKQNAFFRDSKAK